MSRMVFAMKELTQIREWLRSEKGNWTGIAKRTGLSTKTIQRIAREPERFVSMRTLIALQDAMSPDGRTTKEVA